MAKFTYRMQNILDINLKLESQAKTAYGQATQKYQEEQEKLQELILRRVRYEKKLKSLMEGKLDMSALKNARADVNTMKNMVRRQMMEVHKAEIEMNEAQEKLQKVVMERKTQEVLKEKAFENFKKELAEQETKEIDELVSYTYNNKEEQ